MNAIAEKRAPMVQVSLRRPVVRYGIAAGGVLLGWWFYQTGQSALATAVVVWGLSEF